MKCVLINNAQSNDKALRVPDEEAKKMVDGGNWHYVPKSVWKRTTRNNNQ